MQISRKHSQVTWNSPASQCQHHHTTERARKNKQASQSIRSANTHKSKYSSSSKLTKSQLFCTISKKACQQRNHQLVIQRDTQIQILESSLSVLQKNQKNLLFGLGQLLKQTADQAEELIAQFQSIE